MIVTIRVLCVAMLALLARLSWGSVAHQDDSYQYGAVFPVLDTQIHVYGVAQKLLDTMTVVAQAD